MGLGLVLGRGLERVPAPIPMPPIPGLGLMGIPGLGLIRRLGRGLAIVPGLLMAPGLLIISGLADA